MKLTLSKPSWRHALFPLGEYLDANGCDLGWARYDDINRFGRAALDCTEGCERVCRCTLTDTLSDMQVKTLLFRLHIAQVLAKDTLRTFDACAKCNDKRKTRRLCRRHYLAMRTLDETRDYQAAVDRYLKGRGR